MKKIRSLVCFSLVLVILLSLVSCAPAAKQASPVGEAGGPKPGDYSGVCPYGKTEAEVLRVVDGDTLKIRLPGQKKAERLRLLGIDTPESVAPQEERNVPEGKIASRYTDEQLSGKTVELFFDAEPRDHYGRLLAYVYLDGQLFNLRLLQMGYARLDLVKPNVYHEKEFREAVRKAEKEKLGFWSGKVFDRYRGKWNRPAQEPKH